MTNQNVVVPESMDIAVVVVANPAPMCPYLPPKGGGAAAAGGRGGFGIIRKCLPQLDLSENGGSGRINVWIETMEASSPKHESAAPATLGVSASITGSHEHSTWMLSHPSALSMFDEITKASIGKQVVMFLDYDGTLSPIVDDPDRAFMSDEMRDAVRDVARYFPTAIVSGRCRNKVYSFVRLAELYYAGSHGMDIKVPAKGPSLKKPNGKAVLFQPASKFLPMIDKVYRTLLEATKSTPGAKVENNKFCVSVHFRCVDEKKWRALADRVKSVLKEYPKLRLTPGRKVLEIRPIIKWDKGRAMEFLLKSLGFADCKDVLPVYIGDDLTDEDAFKVLRNRGQGFGILVSKIPKETSASYSLQEPSEVCYGLLATASGVEETYLEVLYNGVDWIKYVPRTTH